ncbi:MAG: winged helix-turn-helix domain-containing protein [Candidatus Binatia bacterium]
MWDIQKLLRTKREECRALVTAEDDSESSDRLRLVRHEVAVLESAVRVLSENEVEHRSPRRGLIDPDSSMGLAIDILEDAGQPLHVDEILRQAVTRGHAVTKAGLTSRLAKMVKDHNTFEQVAPATFGLLKWQKTGEPFQAPVPRITAARWDERERAKHNVTLMKQRRRP